MMEMHILMAVLLLLMLLSSLFGSGGAGASRADINKAVSAPAVMLSSVLLFFCGQPKAGNRTTQKQAANKRINLNFFSPSPPFELSTATMR